MIFGPKKKENNDQQIEQAMILIDNMTDEELDEVMEHEIVKRKLREIHGQ